MVPKDGWQNLLESRKSKSIEFRRREASLLAMAFLGIVFLSVLVSINYQDYPPLLVQILLANDIGLLATVIYYLKTKNLKLCGFITTGIALVLNVLLIYSGGKDDTALYWVMFFPLVAFSILGVKWGSIYTLLLFAISNFLLYVPGYILAEYNSVEMSRFLMAFVCVCTFSFINEYFRSREYSEAKSVTLRYQMDANTDALTGLPNRRFLDSNYLKNIVKEQEHFCIVLADIDKFKRVNDTYGHDIGDEALIHTASVFVDNIRSSDLLCRYGGEEFLFCLPNTELHQATRIAEKLRADLEQTPLNASNGEVLNLTSSFGVASLSKQTFEDALVQADKHLYKSKAEGRNRVTG